MKTATIFDCEYLTLEESMKHFWCGPRDPDPIVVQIGAVRLELSSELRIQDQIVLYITPRDRWGSRYSLNPFFTEFTGITEDDVAQKGLELSDALASFTTFSDQGMIWSWGKDELNALGISCFIQDIPFPIKAKRFDNASKLLLSAGMSYDDLMSTRSSGLARYFGLPDEGLRAHDAISDALSITYALQHCVRNGRLDPEALSQPLPGKITS